MADQEFLGGKLSAKLGLLGALIGIEGRVTRGVGWHEHPPILQGSLPCADHMLAAHQVLAEGAGGTLIGHPSW